MLDRSRAAQGRRMILTDERKITDENVLAVVQQAYFDHLTNRGEMIFLYDYEAGKQPLQRQKKIRSDIDIQDIDNLANECVEFKLGYGWGQPIHYVQRGDNKNAPGGTKEEAISLLNGMLDAENAAASDQTLGRDVEITGVGYQMIDIKRTYDGSLFDLITLSPLETFLIRDCTIRRNILASVTYFTTEDGNSFFTVFTPEKRYEIKNLITIENGERKSEWIHGQRSGEENPLHMVPVVETIRSSDRMGCFERQIPEMDSLNVEKSDFANSVAQDTQSIWWGNDVNFPDDKTTGGKKSPKSGQWVLTYTGQGSGKQPKIQPLVIQTDYAGILQSIEYKRACIKQKMSVPVETTPGGGSTGMAMSMSSGWQKAEVAAAREENFIRRGKMQIADLILRAIRENPDTPADSPLLTLELSDIKPEIPRTKSYDMSVKANTFATWVKNGIDPRHALVQVEAFPDPALVYEDSREILTALQKRLVEGGRIDTDRIQQDPSDQIGNSPILDGMGTEGTRL